MYIYISHFVHSVSFVVPRGLGTRVTSSKRKKKEQKPPSPVAHLHSYLRFLSVCMYAFVYVGLRYLYAYMFLLEQLIICKRSVLIRAGARGSLQRFARERYALGDAPEVSRFYETAVSLNSRGSLGTRTTITPILRDDRAMITRGIDSRCRRRVAQRRRRQ